MPGPRLPRAVNGWLTATLLVSALSPGCVNWNFDPVITLISPNGGEVCPGGFALRISWHCAHVDHVRVELSRDAGASWEVLAPSLPAERREFTWVVAGPRSDLCVIRVSDVAGAARDQSDAVFFIATDSITLDSPRGGDIWGVGSSHDIRWTSAGVGNVRIELSRDGAQSWEVLAPSVDAGAGSFSWTVDAGGRGLPQPGCVVRASAVENAALVDASGEFSIVQSVVWYVDADAPALGDGMSWDRAFRGPQAAIDAAQPGDEVRVAGGTYKPAETIDRSLSFAMKDGVALYGGYAGYGEVDPDERDCSAHVTILSGDIGAPGYLGDNSYRVVVGASAARLDGFTVTGGNADGSWPENHGGALFAQSATDLTLANCTFAGNSSLYGAGAVYIYSSIVAVGNCTFTGNSSESGGAVRVRSSSAEIVNCVFTDNTAQRGGAVHAYSSSCIDVLSCTFTGNSAAICGGAIYGIEGGVTLKNSVLFGDAAPEGKELLVRGAALVVAHNCIEDQAYAGRDGNAYADPIFVDAAGGDLRVREGSPCIDAADGDAAPATDLEGNARRDDPGMANAGSGAIDYADIGAHEFQGATTGTWIRLLTPIGGTSARVGAELDITWLATADIAGVKIEISRGAGWGPIANLTANDRHHSWTVDDGGLALPQTSCRIRVVDAAYSPRNGTSAIFTICSGIWYVDSGAPLGGDGSSWAEAFRDLQDAIDAAQSGHEVRVAEGTYRPTGTTDRSLSFVMRDGVALYGGYAGWGEVDPDERDWNAHVTILSGDIGIADDDADNSYHVVIGASDARLDGFTVTGGNTIGTPGSRTGAGMLNDYVIGSVVANCTFADNSASWGGGMFNGGSSLVVTSCSFERNLAGDGGGMMNVGGAPYVENTAFIENSAGSGGGMQNKSSSPTVTGCTFVANSGSFCGGLKFEGTCTSSVSRCTFVANRANVGGAMDAWRDECAPVVSNCLFVANSTSGPGGAVRLDSSRPTFVNCTFSGNEATRGGAVHARMTASPAFVDCVLWGNVVTDRDPAFCVEDAAAVEVTYSCVGGGFAGAGNIDADPLFFDPGHWDDGGTPGDTSDDVWIDGDYHLQSEYGRWNPATGSWEFDSFTSPCIDAGDPASEYLSEPTPNGSRVNMGTYGNTSEASKSAP